MRQALATFLSLLVLWAWILLTKTEETKAADPPAAVVHSAEDLRQKWLCRNETAWGECKLAGDVLVVDLGSESFTWASPPPADIKPWDGVR